MKYYRCDMCGARIAPEELRYVLKMSIFAAYDKMEIELSDLEKDYEEEIRKLTEKMEHMDPKQLEELGGSLRSIRFAFFHQGVRRSVEARSNAVLSLTSADEEDLAEFSTEQERLLLKHARPREAGA